MKADAKPTFTTVAKLIAKGAPSDWLVPGLDFFSGFIRGDPVPSKERKHHDKILARMCDAADYLTKHLPLFTRLSLGLRCPDDVAVALAVLPKIKKRLTHAILPKRAGGQHPNVERKVCAAVVVEAWRSIHGKPEPESPKLWTACNEYWQACGKEYRGSDVDTWRKDCRDAVADNHEWIRRILSAFKTGHN
jgi:hypothetical protein